MIELLERGRQEIPRTPEQFGPIAPSIPLDHLEADAPFVPPYLGIDHRRHPTASNDESAQYWEQLRPRVLTPEYRNATNRTAVVIGESSLIAALPDISEDTIILLDKSQDMVTYMSWYVQMLREAGDIQEWGEQLLNTKGQNFRPFDANPKYYAEGALDQAFEWQEAGRAHPYIEEGLFEKVQVLAREKAIIPWRGDITSRKDMMNLGRVLKANGANVTLINLTNVPGCDLSFSDASEFADSLDLLPVTDNAPILTTSRRPMFDFAKDRISQVVQATGPFFGTENLRNFGGSTGDGLSGGTILQRDYIYPDRVRKMEKELSKAEMLGILALELIGQLAEESIQGNGQPTFAGIVEMTPDGMIPIDLKDAPPEVLEALRDIVKGTNLGL